MGIKGFFPWLKKQVTGQPEKLKDFRPFSGQGLAFDLKLISYSLFLYGSVEKSYLIRVIELYLDCIQYNVRPFFVLDGKPPELKREENEKRGEKKRKAIEDKEEAEENFRRKKIALSIEDEDGTPSPYKVEISKDDEEELKQLEQDFIKKKMRDINVTRESMELICQVYKLLGGQLVRAPSEGEACCAVMNRLGMPDKVTGRWIKVAGVVSGDSDLFAFGAKLQVTGLGGRFTRFENLAQYKIPHCLDKLGLNSEQIAEVAVLSGCDFGGEKIKDVGPVKAKTIMATHGNLAGFCSFVNGEKLKLALNPPKPKKIRAKPKTKTISKPKVVYPVKTCVSPNATNQIMTAMKDPVQKKAFYDSKQFYLDYATMTTLPQECLDSEYQPFDFDLLLAFLLEHDIANAEVIAADALARIVEFAPETMKIKPTRTNILQDLEKTDLQFSDQQETDQLFSLPDLEKTDLQFSDQQETNQLFSLPKPKVLTITSPTEDESYNKFKKFSQIDDMF